MDHIKVDNSVFANNCAKDCNTSVNTDGKCHGSCFNICPLVCKLLCLDVPFPPSHVFQKSPPPPPPLRPPVILPNPLNEAGGLAQKHLITTSMIIMGCLLGATILICILATYLRVKQRRSRTPPIFFGTQEDFLDEDQGPQIDHPIWYINTIGLHQSVIDLIAVVKFKKDEGLIEGTDCSVCLNEFQEDESLRLLPKCSHAFHIPCIDTWLRSHKNCPLCRAPIVSDDFDIQAALSVPSSSDLSSRREPQMENSEYNNGMIIASHQLGEDGSSDVGTGDDMNRPLPIEDETNGGNSKMVSNLSNLRNHSRVQSDLADTRQRVETEMQPVRRSASLDSSSAIAIYNSVANIVPAKHQENVDMQMVQLKHLRLKNVSKQGSNGSTSFHKLMKSSSIGHALQKAPISMKRSFSSSWKSSSSSSSRHSRSQDSILPV